MSVPDTYVCTGPDRPDGIDLSSGSERGFRPDRGGDSVETQTSPTPPERPLTWYSRTLGKDTRGTDPRLTPL